MDHPKRPILQIQLKDFIPIRQHAQNLLREEIGLLEPRVCRIIDTIDHLKLSWELLIDSRISNEPLIIEIIDLLFVNYLGKHINRIMKILAQLNQELYRYPSYQKLKTAASRCRQKLKELKIQEFNEESIRKIH